MPNNTLFRSRLGSLGWEKSLNVVKAVSVMTMERTKPDLIVQGWQVVGPFPFEEGINQRFTKLGRLEREIHR